MTTKSTLVITTANRDDMGEYRCTADFGGSIVISEPASILLFGKIRDENIVKFVPALNSRIRIRIKKSRINS